MALNTVILIGIFAIALWKYAFYRPKNFPPGPPRIPKVGAYLFFCLINYKHLHKAAIWFGKFYKSNVIGVFLGPVPTIIALDHKSVKELLSNPDCDGRSDTFLSRIRDPDRQVRGIFFTDGDFWKDQRRFFLRQMRDFGFGRRFTDLEIGMGEEVQEFVDMIRGGPQYKFEQGFLRKNGENRSFCAPNIFLSFYSNAFLKIVTGRSFPREDRNKLLQLGLKGMGFHKYSEVYGRLLNMIPNLRFFFPSWTGYNEIRESNRSFYHFAEVIVDAEMESYSESGANDKTNFIHLYAEQMDLAKAQLIENPAYHRKQLIMLLSDFLFAAATTVATQTSFLLQHLLINPSCAKKIQTELDDVVGRGRLPTLDDRVSLNYTEAALREIMRLETVAPTAMAHVALKDTTLSGYDVKQGTFLFPTLYAFHRDSDYWGSDADEFKPERFLDDTGKLSLKLDQSLPFGHGGRLCPGETFARNNLFLLATGLLQNFNFHVPEGEKIRLDKTIGGFIRHPPPFWVSVTERGFTGTETGDGADAL